MHMDGVRAGTLATRAGVGRMIATHIQPWTPRERVLSGDSSGVERVLSNSRLPAWRSASERSLAPSIGGARPVRTCQSEGVE